MFARGDSLEQPRDIEFEIIFFAADLADRFLATAKHLGYEAACYHWEIQREWHVCITIYMLPEHEALTRMEEKLTPLAQEFLGDFDGWSSYVMKSDPGGGPEA
jgi:hypothetical protein